MKLAYWKILLPVIAFGSLAAVFGAAWLVNRHYGEPYGVYSFFAFFVAVMGFYRWLIVRHERKSIDKIFAGTSFTIHSAYHYNGLNFCELEGGDKTIAIDMSIEGINNQIEMDEIEFIDAETGQKSDHNNSFVNYVFLDPKSGQVIEPKPGPIPQLIRLLIVYNVPEKLESFKLTLHGRAITPQPVPIRSTPPLNDPQPTEPDFNKAYTALEERLYGREVKNLE